MKTKISCLICILLSGIVFLSPAFSGEGRKRISEIKNSHFSIDNIKIEIEFGRNLAARIIGIYGLFENEKINQYVNMVGSAVALFSGRPELRFHFGVLDTEEVNAFASPGGYVFITRGAIVEMENEAQLAAVLGHEIAHITNNHIIDEINIKQYDNSLLSGLSVLIEGATGSFKGVAEQALESATDILFEKGYKIEDEIEADRVGILMASVAGYNPLALREFLIKVKKFEIEDNMLIENHPKHLFRINKIDQVLNINSLINVKKANVRERFYENIRH